MSFTPPSEKCPVCESPAFVQNGEKFDSIDCVRCGLFSISSLAHRPKLSPEEIATLSWYLYESGGEAFLEVDDIPALLKSLHVPGVAVRSEKLLLYLVKHRPRIGAGLGIFYPAFIEDRNFCEEVVNAHRSASEENALKSLRFHFGLLAVTASADREEVFYLLKEVLGRQMGVLELEGVVFRITPKGWDYLAALKRNPLSSFAFVAMSFKPELTFLYDKGLKPGIESAGYNPLRLDRHEHVNRIDDEIIAMLRRARFCVADLTFQNNGAYFEAGYALGFGIPVVWTCRKGDEPHFDTRQFNTIEWTEEAMPKLAHDLRFRIERVVGRGPNAGSE